MKIKIAAILICMLIAIFSVFNFATSTSAEKQISVTQNNSSRQGITTLITEYLGSRVIEVDSDGFIVWQKIGLNQPFDAERLANGNTLIAEMGGNRVIEVDIDGNIVWDFSTLVGPSDVERLANGNTLITDTYVNRVIEVDSAGTIVWAKTGLNFPVDAERLTTGNTLVTEVYNNRVIEIDSNGTIIWQKAGLNEPLDAERLENGNTLIADTEAYRIIEVDNSGNIVWQYDSSGVLLDAERFANGNTLITEFYIGNRVIEVDSNGTIIWQKAGLIHPVDAERISNPPDAPTINGQTSGKPGKEYEYTFNATDPDGDDVRYIIDWGDNTSNMTDYNPSGTDVKVKHTWSKKGNYTIKAKAIDIYGTVSDWATFTVIMPRNKVLANSCQLWFLERFPILQKILGFIF